jgi:hypothetical protein
MTDPRTPDADGWIEWHGGVNPLPGKRVDVRTLGTGEWVDWVSDQWGESWGHDNGDRCADDIIAYRLTPSPAGTVEPFQQAVAALEAWDGYGGVTPGVIADQANDMANAIRRLVAPSAETVEDASERALWREHDRRATPSGQGGTLGRIFEQGSIPPGEPVKGETYIADGWVYRDLPAMTRVFFGEFVALVGSHNLVWLLVADYGRMRRGQVLISPEGQARIRARTSPADRIEEFPEDLSQENKDVPD